MRILLTGTSGQVGGVLAGLLSEFGEVVAANRAMLDLADVASIPAKLDAIAPDVIVNPAAYTAVDRAEDEPELAFRVNGEAPGAIARWAAARKVPVVHFSTDYVFSGSGERPWREDDATGPLSALRQEQACGRAGAARRGRPASDRAVLVGLSPHRNELPADHRAACRGARRIADRRRPDRRADLRGADRRDADGACCENSAATFPRLPRPPAARCTSPRQAGKLARLRHRHRRGPQGPRTAGPCRAHRADQDIRVSDQGDTAAQLAARSGAHHRAARPADAVMASGARNRARSGRTSAQLDNRNICQGLATDSKIKRPALPS